MEATLPEIAWLVADKSQSAYCNCSLWHMLFNQRPPKQAASKVWFSCLVARQSKWAWPGLRETPCGETGEEQFYNFSSFDTPSSGGWDLLDFSLTWWPMALHGMQGQEWNRGVQWLGHTPLAAQSSSFGCMHSEFFITAISASCSGMKLFCLFV